MQTAVRISAARALKAALPTPIVVYDSPQEPLTELWKEGAFPIVAIFTGSAGVKYEGRNLLGGSARMDIQFQFILPEAVSFDVAVGDSETISIDARREGAEIAFDVLWRIASRALNSSPEPWATLWRVFVISTPEASIDSYMVMHEGVRAPGRQISLTCDPIHEPIPGGAPAGVWADLLTLMRADVGADGLSNLADWIESEIRGGADLPQFKRDQAYMGISSNVGDMLEVSDLVHDVNNSDDPVNYEVPADPDDPDAQI